MTRLSPDQVEEAFVETAREQVNGEPFDWRRLAHKLNERLADADYQRRSAFLLGRDE